jgi:hypothetical protein
MQLDALESERIVILGDTFRRIARQAAPRPRGDQILEPRRDGGGTR